MTRTMLPHAVRRAATVALGAVLLCFHQGRADVIVTATVTPIGSLYHYAYEITNDPPFPGDDLILVDIRVAAMDATLTNLLAPVGFQAVYDFGLGIVSFLPDSGSADVFAVGVTHTGFGFDSALPAGPSTFEVLTVLGEFVDGPTQAPVDDSSPVVPEPTSLVLLTAGLGALAARRRVRRSAG